MFNAGEMIVVLYFFTQEFIVTVNIIWYWIESIELLWLRKQIEYCCWHISYIKSCLK